MNTQTERLILLLLNAAQLELLICDIPALEAQLNCAYRAEPVSGEFAAILRGQLEILRDDPENCRWHSFWLILRKSDRTVVGSADFKRPPDERGEVEIGYGLGEGFCGSGYMTETVNAMCGWAFTQAGVNAVIAETEIDNRRSQSVLKRCGFKLVRTESTLCFRLSRP